MLIPLVIGFVGNLGMAHPALGMLVTIVVSLCVVVIGIGRLLCLAAPATTGARGYILGAVACDLIVLILSVLPSQASITWLRVLLGAGGMFLFLLFLKQIANAKRRNDLAEQAQNIIYLQIGLMAAPLLMLVMLPGLGLLLLPLSLGIMIMSLASFFLFLTLIKELIDVLQ